MHGHQQHHRQQRGRLGWRGNLAAGCVEREHHQQHDLSNDTTASSGVLFNTLGAPLASAQGPTCTTNCGTASCAAARRPGEHPEQRGLARRICRRRSPARPGTSPAPRPPTATAGRARCRCCINDVFWQNRSFYIGVGALGAGTLNQQNVVALVPTLNQATHRRSASATYRQRGTTGTSACAATRGRPTTPPASRWRRRTRC